MMIKPFVAAALALGSVSIVPAADAQRYGYGYPDARYEQAYRDDDRQQDWYRQQDWRGQDYHRGGYQQAGRGFDQRGYDARRYDGRGYRSCNNGTAGTLLGALAGGLLGRALDGRGDRAVGTVIGAGAGALAGRAVAKSNNPGYCR